MKRIIIILVLAFLIFPHSVLAQTPGIADDCSIPTGNENLTESLGVVTETYKPIIINFNLPGITVPYVPGEGDENTGSGNDNQQYQVKNLQCFIVGIYVYFSGVAGILATVMIMYGGVKYVISMGNPSRMGDAKDTIFSAVVGLVLVLGAYVLLNLINPNLTTLRVPGLDLANVGKVNEHCTNEATPKIEGKTSCGNFGVEKIIQDDPNTDEIESYEKECMYFSCDSDSEVCSPGTLQDPNADEYNCFNPFTRCNSVNDGQNVQEAQSSCDPYTVDGAGKCIWHDESWASTAQDKCQWHPLITCPNDTWQKVACDEGCPNDGECKNYIPGTVVINPGEYECSNNEPLFERFPEYSKDAVCCKKILVVPPSEIWTDRGYNVGDYFCSTQSWHPDSKASYF